ncbi:probable glutamate receptor isoform X1 [Centruroides sculpturatus]|uniref:probable glutamate receptor isoform X1 n=1 Tax=Centruroides sculpturatus TaxID=218467 RepID=UPI000C6E4549|nr:probable glutamate receptor isoform X1 [Centruroides sculpturatus]
MFDFMFEFIFMNDSGRSNLFFEFSKPEEEPIRSYENVCYLSFSDTVCTTYRLVVAVNLNYRYPNVSYPFVVWNMEIEVPKVIGGADICLLNILAEKLHFSYEAVLPLELQYGVINENGAWTGMIGMVANNRTDIGVPNAFITTSRLTVVDFGSPYIYYTSNFIVRAPTKLSKETAIIRPFDKYLWLWIFITLTIVGVVIYGIVHIEENEIHHYLYFSKIYWWMFSIFIGQASGNDNALTKCRCIIGLSRLCFVALLSAYSGMLISHLSFPIFTDVLNKFEELAIKVENGEYECGSMKGSANEALFLKSQEGLLKILGNVMNKNENRCVNMKQALEKVLNEKYAFIFVSHLIQYPVLKAGPENYHMSEGIFSFPSSISFSKDFPLKKEFQKL